MAKLTYGANGRPYVICPYCERLHPIVRRKEYAGKPNLRFRCSACKRIFYPTDEQSAELLAHFSSDKNNQDPDRRRKPTAKTNPQNTGDSRDAKSKPKGRGDIWSRLTGQ